MILQLWRRRGSLSIRGGRGGRGDGRSRGSRWGRGFGLRSTRLLGLGLGTRGSRRGGHREGSRRGCGDGLHLAFLSGARSGRALVIQRSVDGHSGIDVQGRSGGNLDRQRGRRDPNRGGGGEGFDEVAQGDKDFAAILGILGEVKEVRLHL